MTTKDHAPRYSHRWCRRVLFMFAVFATAMAHAADVFPGGPVKLIVPFPPGGGADAVARLIAQHLSVRLGQPVVIDNRAGANGAIGTAAVAKAPADGYTLLMTDRGALGINPSLYRKLAYDPLKDFAYVGVVASAPYVLLQSATRPARSLQAVLAAAKGASCKTNYASFGIGSLPQMGMESLNAHFGVCTTHVPYKGGGPALTAAISGEVDLTLTTLGPAMPHIKDGRVVPIAIGGSQRSRQLPQVPAISELGAPADLFPATWFGFAYPLQTPQAIVDRMSADIRAVLALPDVRTRLIEDGFEPGAVDPLQMAGDVRTDVGRFSRLAQRIGIQAE